MLGVGTHHTIMGLSNLKLQTSKQFQNQNNLTTFLESHKLVVERVKATIFPSMNSLVGSDHKMSTSQEEDDEMLDPEEPDDMMTLDQYQNRLRNEALARKLPQQFDPSKKKG